MHNTAGRLIIVAALVVLTFAVAHFVQAGLEPPGVQMPGWTFKDMPMQLGPWHGQPTKMDPEIEGATEATPGTIENREYRDQSGHAVSMHTAMFDKPGGGVYHTPINCYRANGWNHIATTREKLEVSDKLTIPVSLTTWEHEKTQERIIVVYWYQLGEHVLFNRWDLGFKVRWSLRGRSQWPALIKVMLHIAAPDPDDAKSTILEFAKRVATWENQPEHRAQMLGEAGPSASQQSSSKK
jgi:EpsI family protein